jgi:hypothetical protein
MTKFANIALSDYISAIYCFRDQTLNMGNLFGKSKKKESRVTEQDKAVLVREYT